MSELREQLVNARRALQAILSESDRSKVSEAQTSTFTELREAAPGAPDHYAKLREGFRTLGRGELEAHLGAGHAGHVATMPTTPADRFTAMYESFRDLGMDEQSATAAANGHYGSHTTPAPIVNTKRDAWDEYAEAQNLPAGYAAIMREGRG